MATMMGLHCHDAIAPAQMDLDLSLDEIAERRKLFRSLHIRERCYATARGNSSSTSTLSADTKSGSSLRAMSQDSSSATLTAGRGGSPSVSTGYDETNEPLFSIAMIQDELHAAIFPGNPPETRMLKQKMALTGIRQKLITFAKTHRLPSLTRPETFQDLSIHLAYLGTRIRAYELDLTDGDEHNVLDDARLSCLLVMSACSDEKGLEAAAANKLDRLLHRMAFRNWRIDDTPFPRRSPRESSEPAGELPTEGEGSLNNSKAPNKRFWPFGTDSLASPNTQVLRGQRILELIPTSAIFILARNILGIQTNVASSQQVSAPSDSDPISQSHRDELLGNGNEDLAILHEFSRTLESSLGVSSEAQNNYSSKLLRVVQTLVNFIRESSGLPVRQPSSPSEMRQDMFEFSAHADMPQDGGLSSSASAGAAEAFMSLGTTWESPQASNTFSFPFSPSFDLSSMNISTVTDSLFDFDFSQHFDSVGGFMSPAEHLPEPDSLRSVTEQEKRKKRLRLDCSQELDGPGDIMMSSWPPRNRATMARGSV
ncbi:hypothetical protein INS49_000860 [Diaporthe citri]|uniref:uncharacterized protein n=1 Tax=Diaporthe citri TaxID=83186 RepID=UPI001C816662|nr:uncharacterized protein INS49_000860 [Diaporthe citri]KAG6366681.1 hypothetical protein INS49_000860 [Diaporthe citri]